MCFMYFSKKLYKSSSGVCFSFVFSGVKKHTEKPSNTRLLFMIIFLINETRVIKIRVNNLYFLCVHLCCIIYYVYVVRRSFVIIIVVVVVCCYWTTTHFFLPFQLKTLISQWGFWWIKFQNLIICREIEKSTWK